MHTQPIQILRALFCLAALFGLRHDAAAQCVPPSITRHPVDRFVTTSSKLFLGFGVTASGTSPFSYQWYRNNSPIITGTNRSYSVPAHPEHSGVYFVTVSNCSGVVAISSNALVAISDPPYVLLGLTNHTWHYEQSGLDLGSGWKEISFDDSAWPTGRGVLAFENDNALVLSLTNTVLSRKRPNGSTIITHYFRTHFTLTNEPADVILLSSNLFDDGIVVYLNGDEAYRMNMPAGLIDASMLAPAASAEGHFITTNFPSGFVRQGDNVLAVEVHQYDASDVVLGMGLSVRMLSAGPPAISLQPAGTTVFEGENVSMSVLASAGTGIRYQWFNTGVAVPGATNTFFVQTNISPGRAGFYYVTLSNTFGVVTSSVVTLTVLSPQRSLRLLEFTNTWRFNLSGSDLGTTWRALAYDDTLWHSGAGVLGTSGFERFPELLNTPLPLNNLGGNVITTYYFRAHFQVPVGISNLVLVSSNLVDDGALFYINGAEAGRIRLNGIINANTFANSSPTQGRVHEAIFLAATNLRDGDNVLAVEIHQVNEYSADVIFGMNLLAYGFPTQPLAMLTPLSSQTAEEGTPAPFTAHVFGGNPIWVQWFQNGARLPGETNLALRLPAVHSADAADYSFIASNLVNSVTSSVARLFVTPDTAPPTILAAFGTNGTEGIVVVFSEPVTPQAATNINHYRLSPETSIERAELIAPDRVLLVTSGLNVQIDYVLTVSNIIDRADTPNAAVSAISAKVQPNRFSIATGLLQVQTVFVIVMENTDWADVKGSTNAPCLNSLLPHASYCERYTSPGNLHLSQPNYIWFEAGTHFGHTNDSGRTLTRISSTNHLVTQLYHSGVEWRGYMEGMPYGSTGTTDAGVYLGRHNPFAFFDDVTTNYDYCTNHVRPYAEFAGDLAAGRIGRYNFIAPNITNAMHTLAPGSSSLIRQGDDWLARELPRILNSAAFSNNGALFIMFDENNPNRFTPEPIGMIVLSSLAKGNGYASHVPYDHSSTLRTMQEIFGVRPYLGAAGNANPLSDLFKHFSLALVFSNDFAHVRLDNVLPGRTNYVQASSNLVHWSTLSTNIATNTITIFDPGATGSSQRFYRAVELP